MLVSAFMLIPSLASAEVFGVFGTNSLYTAGIENNPTNTNTNSTNGNTNGTTGNNSSNDGSTNTNTSTTASTNPSPTISYLSFNSTGAVASPVTFAVNGTNFVPNSSVRYNGSARSTTYQNSRQLLVTLTPNDVSSAGVGTITVFNPTPGGGTSNSVTFTVTAENNPVPAINTISPSQANSGSGAMNITIVGSNFTRNSVARWNSSDRTTTFINSNQLTMALTKADIDGSGHYLITVVNPLPGGGISNGVIFTILGGPTAGAAASTTPNKPTEAEPAATKSVSKTSGAKTAGAAATTGSSLSANALFGDDGFLPHNLIQWMYVIVLVLLGVIFYRKLYTDNPKNQAPLKHK